MRITNCEKGRVKKRRRRTLSITIDPHVLDALKQWMGNRGEHNLSAVIEGFIDCGVRDTCEGCPETYGPMRRRCVFARASRSFR